MSKKRFAKQLLTIPEKTVERVLPSKPESKRGAHTLILSKYAGSIEFSDDEFSAMLQALKDDK